MDYKKWDARFLNLAKFVSSWSKDYSTKVGSVITRGKKFISLGFNGFPEGTDDSPELYKDREQKIARIQHAEINAINFSEVKLEGCTIYTYPFMPCSQCAGSIIHKGIKRVVSIPMSEDIRSRWGSNIEISKQLFRDAGIEVVIFDDLSH